MLKEVLTASDLIRELPADAKVAIEEPETGYENYEFGLNFSTSHNAEGQAQVSCNLSLRPVRVLKSGAVKSAPDWRARHYSCSTLQPLTDVETALVKAISAAVGAFVAANPKVAIEVQP